MRRDLHEGRRVVRPPLKTRPRFGIHAYRTLLAQVRHRIRYLLLVIDDDHFPFERRYRHPLQQLFVNMMCLIWHVMPALRLKLSVPNVP